MTRVHLADHETRAYPLRPHPWRQNAAVSLPLRRHHRPMALGGARRACRMRCRRWCPRRRLPCRIPWVTPTRLPPTLPLPPLPSARTSPSVSPPSLCRRAPDPCWLGRCRPWPAAWDAVPPATDGTGAHRRASRGAPLAPAVPGPCALLERLWSHLLSAPAHASASPLEWLTAPAWTSPATGTAVALPRQVPPVAITATTRTRRPAPVP
jgi:hypothetical protein